MKLFNGILGVFAAFAALFCFMYPGRTFLTAGWMVTFLLVCWGICVLFDCISNKVEKKSKNTLAKGIIAVVFGLATGCASALAIVYPQLSLITDMIIILAFLAWVFLNGISQIIIAVRMKQASTSKKWIFVLIIGIITAVSAVYGLCHTFMTAWAITVMFGVVLTSCSVRLLSTLFE